jgi:hypothetical protein
LVPIAITFLSACGLVGLAYGGNDKPATQPVSAERVARWVADLGADDYPTRAAATKALADAGAAAADALRKAASESDDPERASRAVALLARLEGSPSSLTAREMLEVFAALSAGGSRRLESAKVVDGGVCELSVQGRDARVVMRCDGKGILIRTELRAEAKDQSCELRARDAADLKKRYQDAWAFYQWTTRNMGGDDGAGMRSWFEQFLVRGG